jgi:anthranilate phosphoribosyltransferase
MSEFRDILIKIEKFKSLSKEDAKFAFNFILDGKANELEIEEFLIGLNDKEITVDDILAGVEVLREKSTKVNVPINAIDTCGTGGDKSGTYNISTAATFVAAGAGSIIAKHGNRALSSKSGSSQVLEELGINININSEKISNCINKSNIGFMFAPNHHSAMKYVGPVRQKLNVRTIFNLLGPLINPGNVKKQLIGVFDKKWLTPLAKTLQELGSTDVMLVCGSDGLDEITTTSETYIAELKNKEITNYTIKPEDFGINRANPDELIGDTPKVNAHKILKLLDGEKDAFRDIVVLNSAAAIYISGIADSIEHGLEFANCSIDNGNAKASLEKLVKASNEN